MKGVVANTVIQLAMGMRHIVLSSVASSVPHFFTLYHKRHDFRKQVIEHKMSVLIFCKTSVSNISLFKKKPPPPPDTIKNVHRSSCKVQGYFRWVLTKFEFSLEIFEKHSDIKLYENPHNGSRVFPFGRIDRWSGRQTERERDRRT